MHYAIWEKNTNTVKPVLMITKSCKHRPPFSKKQIWFVSWTDVKNKFTCEHYLPVTEDHCLVQWWSLRTSLTVLQYLDCYTKYSLCWQLTCSKISIGMVQNKRFPFKNVLYTKILYVYLTVMLTWFHLCYGKGFMVVYFTCWMVGLSIWWRYGRPTNFISSSTILVSNVFPRNKVWWSLKLQGENKNY